MKFETIQHSILHYDEVRTGKTHNICKFNPLHYVASYIEDFENDLSSSLVQYLLNNNQHDILYQWITTVSNEHYKTFKDTQKHIKGFNVYGYLMNDTSVIKHYFDGQTLNVNALCYNYIFYGYKLGLCDNPCGLSLSDCYVYLFGNVLPKRLSNFDYSIDTKKYRQQRIYRLGNIIDAWYASKHVKERKACQLAHITRCGNNFGSFLYKFDPEVLTKNLIYENSTFLRDSHKWWWSYNYDCYKEVYPNFNISIRNAIKAYYGQNIYNSYDGENVCVVHFRTGDFLKHKEILDYNKLVNAVKKFKKCPTEFQVLHGGMNHNDFKKSFTPEDESMKLLNDLTQCLKKSYPKSKVNFVNCAHADVDFIRMVTAPMLLTGHGSFAVIAAAANMNERLTPAFKNLNFAHSGKSDPTHIYENWYTYET